MASHPRGLVGVHHAPSASASALHSRRYDGEPRPSAERLPGSLSKNLVMLAAIYLLYTLEARRWNTWS